jgi:predicted ATP-dependent serine protease
MNARPGSGRAWRRIARRGPLAVLAAALLAGAGCASVPAYEREHLVDPIMAFEAQSKKDARLVKSLEAREGSTGGVGGAGGGCACN